VNADKTWVLETSPSKVVQLESKFGTGVASVNLD
jgi:hypothetical protein